MHILGFVYSISAAITWGLAYTIDQKILVHSSPSLLLFCNAILTLLITLPIVIFNGDLRSGLQLEKETIYLIIYAQLFTLLGSLFILSGIKILGASLASIFEIMYPLFVIIFSYLVFGGTFNAYFWIGSSFLFLGSLILIRFA